MERELKSVDWDLKQQRKAINRPIVRVSIYPDVSTITRQPKYAILFVCFLIILGGWLWLVEKTGELLWWPLLAIIPVISLMVYSRRPIEEMKCCEEGIYLKHHAKKSQYSGITFYKWSELLELHVEKVPRESPRYPTLKLMIFFSDKQQVIVNRLDHKIFFSYPKEMALHELVDNAFRYDITPQFVNFLYVLLRRAYKARWTGNVPVQEWLK
jgi:hypothetical protein